MEPDFSKLYPDLSAGVVQTLQYAFRGKSVALVVSSRENEVKNTLFKLARQNGINVGLIRVRNVSSAYEDEVEFTVHDD